MAFSCVLHLKEECDGCGACETVRFARRLQGEDGAFSDWDE